MLGLPSTS